MANFELIFYPFSHIRILRSGKHWRVNIDGEPVFAALGQLVTFYVSYHTGTNQRFLCRKIVDSTLRIKMFRMLRKFNFWWFLTADVR